MKQPKPKSKYSLDGYETAIILIAIAGIAECLNVMIAVANTIK